MANVKKAGCVLINKQNKKIGLIYRDKQKDYSFSKGHMEKGETLKECAVRETEEETGRKCEIISSKALPILIYMDSKGDKTEAYYFLAEDKGPSEIQFDPQIVHKVIWISYDDVAKTLSYQNLIDFWEEIKILVKEKLDENV